MELSLFIGWTKDQQLLRESTRTLLSRVSSEADVRRLMATPEGHDPEAWRQLGELGLLGVTVPSAWGGQGGTFVDQGIALEEMGRAAFGGPYFSTAVLVVQTLLHLDDPGTAADLLNQICSGEVVAALALTEDLCTWDEAGVQLRAEATTSGWRLSGRKSHVLDGGTANVVLVVARTGAGTSLFVVEGNAAGMTRKLLPTMDQTRKQARLDFDRTPARLLGTEGRGWQAVGPALQAAAVGLATEQVGGAQFVLDLVVAYAGARQQFDRPIGSFQAVQHKCANLLVDIEAARSAAYYGLRVVAAGSSELPVVASVAKSFCSATFRRVTNDAIQVLGGIGLTWEHPIHIYFKRARSSEILLGTPAYHRGLLAQSLRL